MMKPMGRLAVFLPALALGLLVLSGCGQVTGPISPIANPPYPAWGTFDDGTTDGWTFDSSTPNITNPMPLTVTSQAFQGPYALQIPVTAYGLAAGVTVTMTGYAVHYDFGSGNEQNLTDMTLSMWICLKSGLVVPPNQVGTQIFVKDDVNLDGVNWSYANGTFVKLVPNQWAEVTFNVNAPNYASPGRSPQLNMIRQVGIQIAGNGSSVFTSGGIFDVDSFGYQPNPY